jgi:hypothetical protein
MNIAQDFSSLQDWGCAPGRLCCLGGSYSFFHIFGSTSPHGMYQFPIVGRTDVKGSTLSLYPSTVDHFPFG